MKFLLMAMISTTVFSAVSLEDKVCRGGNTISPDCTMAVMCERRSILNLRAEGNVNWNNVCTRLYDRYNVVDPLSEDLDN